MPHTSVCGRPIVAISQGLAPIETAQHLAVVSEAMLRLASLLRTDHMLSGAQSTNLITQFYLALKEMTEEMALDEA